MQAMLEVHLAHEGDGPIKWVRTYYRNTQTSPPQWTAELRDVWEFRKEQGAEPLPHEILPKWNNPQRAVVAMLLRAVADENRSLALVGPEHPLARSLFDTIRHRSATNGGPTWIQRMFGVKTVRGTLFLEEGSSGGRLRVSFGPDLRNCRVIFHLVQKGPATILKDRGELLRIARAIENQTVPPRVSRKTSRSRTEDGERQSAEDSVQVGTRRGRNVPGPPNLAAADPIFRHCGLASMFKIPAHNEFRQDRVRKLVLSEAKDDHPQFCLLASSGRSFLHPLGPVWDRLGLREAILKVGASMDVVLQSPFSDFGYARALACKVNYHHWEELLCVNDLRELAHRAKVRVRVSQLPINCSLFITRKSALYDPYLWACPAEGKRVENNFWVFEFRPAPLDRVDSYGLLVKHFRFLFDHGIPLDKFLKMGGGYEKLSKQFTQNLRNSSRLPVPKNCR